MPYYQGDYYQGGYYQGGFFSSIAKLGAGLLGRTPIGGALATAGRAIAKIVKRPLARRIGAGVATGVAAGAAFEGGGRLLRARAMPGLGGGGRRMNVANVRALRRAIRRAKGFAKLARRVMTWPIQKPPKGRGLFKKRGR